MTTPADAPIWPTIHFLDATFPEVTRNVALDEALLLEAEDRNGSAVLRVWEMDRFAVVLGASCRFLDNVRVEACRADGVGIARRSSGGGTVVVGPGALNFSVILPIDAAPELSGIESAQRFVMGRTAESIRLEGSMVEIMGSGDLTIGHRKVSGSAQRRLRHHVLIHASVLYDFPIDRIDRYTLLPPRRPNYRGDRPHLDFVTNLPIDRDRLLNAIRRAWLPSALPWSLAAIPIEILVPIFETKFSKSEWIERL